MTVISSDKKVLHFQGATELFHQGEKHPWIYRIHSGFVMVYGVSLSGKQGVTDIYGPGTWFGPGLGDSCAIQNAKTQPDTVLERIEQRELWRHMADDSKLLMQLVQQLSNRERQLRQRLFLQQTATLAMRLAQLLLYLFNTHGRDCRHGHDRDVVLTQQDLAEMIGGSRQSVSQLLAIWKQDGIIDYSRDCICLEDSAALQVIGQG